MDTRRELLAENENRRLNLRLPMLLCFSMFVAWQMGVIYFSGENLVLNSKTPLPINMDVTTVLSVTGFLSSILVMLLLQKYIVWAERIAGTTALVTALTWFLPLPPEILVMFFYIHYFCGLIMTGFETAIIVNLFKEKTAALYLTVIYALPNILVALLHNEIYKVTFTQFRLYTVAALVVMLVFFFKLPAKSWPRYVKKSDGFVMPKSLFAGTLILTGLSALLSMFGTTIAESVTHGVFVFYCVGAVFSVSIGILWKCFGIAPLKSGLVLLALGALGFVAAIVSLYVPALSLAACAMLSGGMACCWLVPFFGLLVAKNYPSRFISPAVIGSAFLAVLVHTALLETLRHNLTMLYVVYLVIAVALTIIYLILEPYLGYSFRGRTLHDIIGVVAEEAEEEAAGTEPGQLNAASAKRAPLLTKTETIKPAAPQDASLHERRMKILMTHALSPLTHREYQLADCIMRGLRRSEIAREMGIEPESITKYSNRIYNKFDIHRRQDLFKLAEKLDREWDEK
jgi:DNA-binding CsgD family transcriptional regulator